MKNRLKSLSVYLLTAALILTAAGCVKSNVSDFGEETADGTETTGNEIINNSEVQTEMDNRLCNTYAKLTEDKALNIVYIGGSVTDGYGASDQNTKSWLAKTNDWFRERFPDAKINGTRCSIGGTGSYLAAFRYEKEVAPKNPDLLFIEYAVNDKYNGQGYDEVLRTSETIVRKAYEHNPNIDIVYILTFDKGDGTSDYDALRAHRDVAEHYGLINIKLSDYVYDMLERTGDDFSKYYMDGVHPNDEGYSYYASVITGVLGEELVTNAPVNAKVTAKVLPEKLSPTLIEDADLVFADKINLSDSVGFEYQSKTNFSWLGMRFNGRIFAKSAGSRITLEFDGTDFGICYGIGPNMGIVSCSVDGGEPVVIDAYRDYKNPKDAVLAWDLEKGKHTVTIEVTGKNEKSGGEEFEIGALLVG